MVNFGPMMGQEPSVSPALEVPEQIARKLHLPAIIINGFMTRFWGGWTSTARQLVLRYHADHRLLRVTGNGRVVIVARFGWLWLTQDRDRHLYCSQLLLNLHARVRRAFAFQDVH